MRRKEANLTKTTFAELGVSSAVCAALARNGIHAPFEIQELMIPEALTGADLLVRAPTGSGKTYAFGLPMIERVSAMPAARGPRALVLAPTRELAVQITGELTDPAQAAGLRIATCYGGVPIPQQAQRAARADILVATPGRLNDLIERRLVTIAGVQILVLDEADRMLDMGFLPQVDRIVAHALHRASDVAVVGDARGRGRRSGGTSDAARDRACASARSRSSSASSTASR